MHAGCFAHRRGVVGKAALSGRRLEKDGDGSIPVFFLPHLPASSLQVGLQSPDKGLGGVLFFFATRFGVVAAYHVCVHIRTQSNTHSMFVHEVHRTKEDAFLFLFLFLSLTDW